MKVVLDTNVLISGTFWTGKSFEILRKIDLKEIILILSNELLNEYHKVVNGDEIIEKIEDKNLITNQIIQKIFNNSNLVSPTIKLNIIKEDITDNKVLECALEGKVDYIITYDKHLLKLKEFEGIKIITPEEFLEKLKIK